MHGVSLEKLKATILNEPQIRQLINDFHFERERTKCKDGIYSCCQKLSGQQKNRIL